MFLPRVYKKNKTAFYCILLFIVIYAISIKKGFDMMPFRYNGMYSFKPRAIDTVSFILYKIDNETLDYTRFLYWKKDLTEMSLQTFDHFSSLSCKDPFGIWLSGKLPEGPVNDYCIAHLANTRQAILLYPEWLYHFLTGKTTTETHHPDIKIVKYMGVFENGNLLLKDSSVIYESVKK